MRRAAIAMNGTNATLIAPRPIDTADQHALRVQEYVVGKNAAQPDRQRVNTAPRLWRCIGLQLLDLQQTNQRDQKAARIQNRCQRETVGGVRLGKNRRRSGQQETQPDHMPQHPQYRVDPGSSQQHRQERQPHAGSDNLHGVQQPVRYRFTRSGCRHHGGPDNADYAGRNDQPAQPLPTPAERQQQTERRVGNADDRVAGDTPFRCHHDCENSWLSKSRSLTTCKLAIMAVCAAKTNDRVAFMTAVSAIFVNWSAVAP